jgi:bacterioferritin (cytochrome b1)
VKPDAVALLNEDLHLEGNAVLIYRAHAAAVRESKIAQGLASILVVEERHAAELVQRITELGGQPETADQFTTASGKAIAATSRFARTAQMLQLDLDEEERATDAYRRHIAALADDEPTTALLSRHLRDEETHARWLVEQISLLHGDRRIT